VGVAGAVDRRDAAGVPCKTGTLRERTMDIFLLLAVVVGVVTVLSGYLLFNDMPKLGSKSDTHRPLRRP
jgi:hypothetical protein